MATTPAVKVRYLLALLRRCSALPAKTFARATHGTRGWRICEACGAEAAAVTKDLLRQRAVQRWQVSQKESFK